MYSGMYLGVCPHISWSMSSYILEYVLIYLGVCSRKDAFARLKKLCLSACRLRKDTLLLVPMFPIDRLPARHGQSNTRVV